MFHPAQSVGCREYLGTPIVSDEYLAKLRVVRRVLKGKLLIQNARRETKCGKTLPGNKCGLHYSSCYIARGVRLYRNSACWMSFSVRSYMIRGRMVFTRRGGRQRVPAGLGTCHPSLERN